MFKTDNNLHVFVGKNSTSTDLVWQPDVTEGTATGNGSIFTVDETGAALAALASGKRFRIGQKHADGSTSYSPLLEFDKCDCKGLAGVDRTEQSSVFGSTGAAGSIDNINSNRYTIRVNFKNNTELFSEQSSLHFFEYVSDANATEVEIVDYFAQMMSKNEYCSGKRSGKKRAMVQVGRFSDQAFSAPSSDSGITALTLTNGSKVVKATGFSSSQSELIVGNYVRFVNAADGTDDPDVDPFYKIAAIDLAADTFTLDQPYQGATLSASMDGTDIHYATAATMASANCGIKISGLAQEFKLGLLRDSQVTFEVTLDGWGDTTAIATTAAVKGSGVAKEVAELEWFGKGAEGAPYRHGVANNADLLTLYADTARDDGASTAARVYDVATIEYTLADPKYPVAGAGNGKGHIIVALPADTHSTDGTAANAFFDGCADSAGTAFGTVFSGS